MAQSATQSRLPSEGVGVVFCVVALLISLRLRRHHAPNNRPRGGSCAIFLWPLHGTPLPLASTVLTAARQCISIFLFISQRKPHIPSRTFDKFNGSGYSSDLVRSRRKAATICVSIVHVLMCESVWCGLCALFAAPGCLGLAPRMPPRSKQPPTPPRPPLPYSSLLLRACLVTFLFISYSPLSNNISVIHHTM